MILIIISVAAPPPEIRTPDNIRIANSVLDIVKYIQYRVDRHLTGWAVNPSDLTKYVALV